jgi:hypothetical protein
VSSSLDPVDCGVWSSWLKAPRSKQEFSWQAKGLYGLIEGLIEIGNKAVGLN